MRAPLHRQPSIVITYDAESQTCAVGYMGAKLNACSVEDVIRDFPQVMHDLKREADQCRTAAIKARDSAFWTEEETARFDAFWADADGECALQTAKAAWRAAKEGK